MNCPTSQIAQAISRMEVSSVGSESRRLLAVSEHRKSGLILCKQFHAEFAGPGAAVFTPVEQPYTAVIAIGSPEIVAVMTHRDRQKAYSRRIQWTRWLEKIADSANAPQRAEKLLNSFEAFFDSNVLVSLPDQILALLAGVLPQTITAVRAQHRALDQGNAALGPELTRPSVCILNPQTLQPFDSGTTVSLASPHGITTLCALAGRLDSSLPEGMVHAKVG